MSGRASVAVLHGLWMPGTEMTLMCRRLRALGYDPHLFRYSTVDGDLAANAQRFAQFAAALPGDTVHVVGYSLGGVVALEALEREAWERPGRVVCVGSPLTGSCTASALARTALGRRIVGRCLGEHCARGGFAAWRGSREVGVIAGNVSLGAGRFVGALTGPNDGTVAIAETQLPGCSDHIVLGLSHFAMLWSAALVRQVAAFLESGHFARTGTSEAAQPSR